MFGDRFLQLLLAHLSPPPLPAEPPVISQPIDEIEDEPEPPTRMNSEVRRGVIRAGELCRHLDKAEKKRAWTLFKAASRARPGRRQTGEVREAWHILSEEGSSWSEIFRRVLGPQEHYKSASPKEKRRMEINLRHRVLEVAREAGDR
jgi:hypothetical protein